MAVTKEELDLYKQLTPAQVRLYKEMHAVRVQWLLVKVCVLIVLVLLGFGIYFLFFDKTAAATCFAASGLFGWIGRRVYTHYFPSPAAGNKG